jgi:uncharacterized protein (DUF433 family)
MPKESRTLVALGKGAFSVPTVCRILQPTMTPRKVHYWLDTELIGEPIYRGSPGRPTILTFEQLLKIAVVQRLRDEFKVSLPRVRDAFAWVLEKQFADDWRELRFARGTDSRVVVAAGNETVAIPGGQGVIDSVLPELTRHASTMRRAWEKGALVIPMFSRLVSNVRVLAGAPTVSGTRIETALIASFADASVADVATIKSIRRTYPSLRTSAIREALRFEGVRLVA